ncbi:hypothetical protein KIN20_016503 [Parelaphostrongylus tenuis]|uniref:Secreted protein n=1 Tax=Parelaphostrongylus tenuis TaxID=148309 RepID=A0AAD5MGK5_PARTN|nr:hypothetical protein KIN20_016503 [Parelaphostrongylus tenuis]
MFFRKLRIIWLVHFILLCKGCGVLSGVAIPGMERQRTLSSSMEEADRPRRLSVTQSQSPVEPSN